MLYEFTVTLKPTMYVHTPRKQWDMTQGILFDIFQGYKVSCVAELTGEHNVHYHAIIDLDGILDKDKLLNKFRKYSKIFGRKTCTQVMFEDSYKKYMRKDIEQTFKVLGVIPIVRDHFGILGHQDDIVKEF